MDIEYPRLPAYQKERIQKDLWPLLKKAGFRKAGQGRFIRVTGGVAQLIYFLVSQRYGTQIGNELFPLYTLRGIYSIHSQPSPTRAYPIKEGLYEQRAGRLYWTPDDEDLFYFRTQMGMELEKWRAGQPNAATNLALRVAACENYHFSRTLHRLPPEIAWEIANDYWTAIYMLTEQMILPEMDRFNTLERLMSLRYGALAEAAGRTDRFPAVHLAHCHYVLAVYDCLHDDFAQGRRRMEEAARQAEVFRAWLRSTGQSASLKDAPMDVSLLLFDFIDRFMAALRIGTAAAFAAVLEEICAENEIYLKWRPKPTPARES